MDENHTAAVVQRYLDALDGDTPAAPIIAALLDRAVGRLEMLCGSMLYPTYHRLTPSPLSLQTDEVLGADFERLVKAMRGVRPLDRARVLRLGQSTHALEAQGPGPPLR
jgi:hypothetical protein